MLRDKKLLVVPALAVLTLFMWTGLSYAQVEPQIEVASAFVNLAENEIRIAGVNFGRCPKVFVQCGSCRERDLYFLEIYRSNCNTIYAKLPQEVLAGNYRVWVVRACCDAGAAVLADCGNAASDGIAGELDCSLDVSNTALVDSARITHLDITVGAVGPVGPAGPAGPQGARGASYLSGCNRWMYTYSVPKNSMQAVIVTCGGTASAMSGGVTVDGQNFQGCDIYHNGQLANPAQWRISMKNDLGSTVTARYTGYCCSSAQSDIAADTAGPTVEVFTQETASVDEESFNEFAE